MALVSPRVDLEGCDRAERERRLRTAEALHESRRVPDAEHPDIEWLGDLVERLASLCICPSRYGGWLLFAGWTAAGTPRIERAESESEARARVVRLVREGG